MRAIYGAESTYLDVTQLLRNVTEIHDYNLLFSDPVHGLVKELVIEDGEVVVKLRENTPIQIDMSERPLLPVYVETPEANDNSRYSALQSLYAKKDEDCILGYVEQGEDGIPGCGKIFNLLPSISLIVNGIDEDGRLLSGVWYARSSHLQRLQPPSHSDTYQWVHQPASPTDHIYSYKNGCRGSPGILISHRPLYDPNKFIFVDLNYTCQYGLTNQILTLCAALFTGVVTKRRVVVAGFCTNYNSKDSVHIRELVDIDRYNQYLEDVGTSLLDVRDIPSVPWRLMDHWSVPYSTSTINERMSDYEYIILPMILYDFNTFIGVPNDEYLPLYMEIRRNFPFSQRIMDRVSHTPHVSAHLRLEDDMINHMIRFHPGFNEEEYVQRVYSSILETCKEVGGPVYICTGLGKYPNRYNYMLENLKKELEIIDTTSFGEGREVDAAVDMATCLNSNIFIGPGKIVNGVVLPTTTTFSSYIADVMMSRGKKILLI